MDEESIQNLTSFQNWIRERMRRDREALRQPDHLVLSPRQAELYRRMTNALRMEAAPANPVTEESSVPPEEDGIRLLDETEAPPRLRGIREVPPPAPVPVPPPAPARRENSGSPQEALLNDQVVFGYKGGLYVDRHGIYDGNENLAYLIYSSAQGDKKPAYAMEWEGMLIISPTKKELDIFKTLCETRQFILGPDREVIAFFVCDEGTMPDRVTINEDSMVGVAFDGKTILYNERGQPGLLMKLDAPLGTDPTKAFGEISKFILRANSKTKDAISNLERQLSQVQGRASEEAFLYLSDFPVPAGREAVHARVMERFTREYEEDAVLLRDLESQKNAQLEIMRKATDQLPSGKKGKPILDGYVKSPVLKDLLDYMSVRRIGDDLAFHFYFRQNLMLHISSADLGPGTTPFVIEYGRPYMMVRLTNNPEGIDRSRFPIRHVTVESLDKRAFLHPHIEGHASWCLGTYVKPLCHALIGGNLPLAAKMLWTYLSTYNRESPLRNIGQCREQMLAAQPKTFIVRRK